MTTGFRIGASLFLLALVSCGPSIPEPRAVQPESDVCPECRMTVVSEGHAAQSIDSEGQIRVFDDPGCLALHLHNHPGDYPGARFFVQDVETRDWVEVAQATWVQADAVASPMNYGWHAFSAPVRAQSFALVHGGVLASGPDILRQVATALESHRWQP